MILQKVALSAASLLLFAMPAQAAQISGKVTSIQTYPSGDIVMFTLANQPTSHPLCNPGYFDFPAGTAQRPFDRIVSQLLAAVQAGKNIQVSYSETTCSERGWLVITGVRLLS
jgi:hypothetical protein